MSETRKTHEALRLADDEPAFRIGQVYFEPFDAGTWQSAWDNLVDSLKCR